MLGLLSRLCTQDEMGDPSVKAPIGHAFANPGFILATALAAGTVIRALGRVRR
jgi:hypothetical protein